VWQKNDALDILSKIFRSRKAGRSLNRMESRDFLGERSHRQLCGGGVLGNRLTGLSMLASFDARQNNT